MAKDFYRPRDTKARLMLARILTLEELGYLDLVEDICHELGGYLSVNGTTPTIEAEARILGLAVEDHERLHMQLHNHLLLQRDEEGRLYSPDLIHELHIRNVRRQAANTRWKPDLDKQMDKQKHDYNYNSDSLSSSLDDGGMGEEGVSSSLLKDGKFEPWVQELFDLYPDTVRTPDYVLTAYWIEKLLGKETVWGFVIEPEHLTLAVQRYDKELTVLGWHGTEYVKNPENFFRSFKGVQKYINPKWKPIRRKPKTYRKGE